MTKQTPKDTGARTAVQALLKADKMKALAVAVMLASTSVAGCTTMPQNEPCPGQPDGAPCTQPSGSKTGWLETPRWPAVEGQVGGPQGKHLATGRDFLANPQYTKLRAGSSDTDSNSPRYYGGGHYYRVYSGGGSSSGISS